MSAGSLPAICTLRGSVSSAWAMRRRDLGVFHTAGLDATISDTAIPAPRRRQSCRKGRSVTPAMGASTTLLLREYGPIRMGANCIAAGVSKGSDAALARTLACPHWHECRRVQGGQCGWPRSSSLGLYCLAGMPVRYPADQVRAAGSLSLYL